MRTLTVTGLNNQIKALLESTFERVVVEGEVSRVTYHSSGHLYFAIKDANSSVDCVMFRGNASRLRFRLEQGQKILIQGAVTTYIPRGSYQVNCFSIEPSGQGALSLAYEQLKNELASLGYFEANRKKVMPRFPKRIALITSKTGAAIADMLRVAQKRWQLTSFTLLNTLVQGEGAAREIAMNINRADQMGFDLMIIGRGGGSLEDLWAFNECIVADAIYHANTPIVSAVGHEIDTMISDYVADMRAPTPSAAIEMVLPDQLELMQYLDHQKDRYHDLMAGQLAQKKRVLEHLQSLLLGQSPQKRLLFLEQNLERLREGFRFYGKNRIQQASSEQERLAEQMRYRMEEYLTQKSFSLRAISERYSLSNPKERLLPNTAQILRNGRSISLKEVKKADKLLLLDGERGVTAEVVDLKVE